MTHETLIDGYITEHMDDTIDRTHRLSNGNRIKVRIVLQRRGHKLKVNAFLTEVD